MLRLQIPVLFCPDCTSQLGFSGVYVVAESGVMVCGFCAKDRIHGGGAELRPVAGPGPRPAPGGGLGVAGEGAPLDQRTAVALLMSKGATIWGRYADRITGEPATPAEMRRLLGQELGVDGV